MDLDSAITAFLAHRRGRRLAATTLELYTRQFAEWQRWRASVQRGPQLADVTLAELRAFIDFLTTAPQRLRPERLGQAPRTVRSMYRTLRALWNFLRYEEDDAGEAVLTSAQQRHFANGRIPLPAISERERPAIGRPLLDALLASIPTPYDELGARDRAILLLLFESGLRAHELAKLHDADCDLRGRSAVVIGKGDKQAVIFWGPRAHKALRAYLRLRTGPIGGPLLRGLNSRNQGDALTANLIRCMLKRRAKAAHVQLPAGATVHGLRHGCARDMRQRGATREEVRDILRHKDLATTMIYLGLDADALGETHRRLFPDDEAPPSADRDADVG